MPLLYAEQLLVIDEFNNEQWTTTYVERSIFQWDVSAADLEQFDPEPLSSIDDERLTWCLVTTAAGVQFPAHHWSPDGSQLVYHVQPPGVSPDEVRVVQVSGNGPVDAEDGELLYLGGLYTIIDPPQWSRHANSSDQRIVFAADGAVRTVRPNGSGLQSVATSDIAPGSNPRWSPDGQHLVYRGRTQKGLKVTWTINRIPGGGGTPTVIYSGVTSRIPLGWVAE